MYIPGKGVNYNGYYYPSLKDESSDACVTLMIPAPKAKDSSSAND